MSNYCACSGGDEEYTIELNQQGPEGPQGPVGPEGFSPSISVKTNTDKAYILTVVNKEGTFDTPNLYGELEKLNADLSNIPNPAFINGISLSSIEDNIPMITMDSSRITTNVDGNLILNATASNEETMEVSNYEVVVNPKNQRLELHDNEGTVKVVAVTDEIAIVQSQLSDKLDRATYEADKATYATKTELASTDATVASIQTELGNKLESSNIIAGTNISIDRSGNNLTISSTGGGGSGDVTAAGNNRFTGDNTFIGKVNIAGGALTVDGLATLNQVTAQYLNAVSITSPGEINATSIKANGLRSDDIQTTENKKYLTEVDVDNQTIQIVNGKLHANLDELGNEVNTLANTVTTLQTSKQDKLTAGANITIVDNVISAIGGGGGGVSIDDSTTSSASTWSSSKINSEITTVVDTINSTKNDNIFDIGKFTVVGSPVISDDGVASGFSTSNYLRINQNIDFTKPFVIEGEFTTSSDISTEQFIFSTTINQSFGIQIYNDGFLYVYYPTTTTNIGSYRKTIQLGANTKYNYKYYYTGTELKLDVNNTTYVIASNEFNPTIATFINLSISRKFTLPFTGSIDLNAFKIYVDGEKVFSGLMESTKPIYDKLSSTSTALSTFQTDTDNNFSAVNSALNEKANLSDLAGYVPYAGNNTFTGSNTFKGNVTFTQNPTSSNVIGITSDVSMVLGSPTNTKLQQLFIARQTADKGGSFVAVGPSNNGRATFSLTRGTTVDASTTSVANFSYDEDGLYYKTANSDEINLIELINTMSSTISSLTDRISALETEINGGNA